MPTAEGKGASRATALVASTVLLLILVYGFVVEADETALLLVGPTSIQVLALAAMSGSTSSQTMKVFLHVLRIVVTIWIAASAVIVASGTWLRFVHHGFLGWDRDGWWETESTATYGLTVGDIAIVGLVIFTQAVTFWALWRVRLFRSAA